jgi:hypothetical protein
VIALRHLGEVDAPWETLARVYADDPEIRGKIIRYLSSVPASLRTVVVSALARRAADGDAYTKVDRAREPHIRLSQVGCRAGPLISRNVGVSFTARRALHAKSPKITSTTRAGRAKPVDARSDRAAGIETFQLLLKGEISEALPEKPWIGEAPSWSWFKHQLKGGPWHDAFSSIIVHEGQPSL